MGKYCKHLLILCLSISFFNCSRDNGELIVEKQEQSPIEFEHISFEQFRKHEAAAVMPILGPFLDEHEATTTTGKDKRRKLIIHTDNIRKIVKDGVESYTFFIETNDKNGASFENLVVQKKDSDYHFFKVRYTPQKGVPEMPYRAKFRELPENSLDTDILEGLVKNGNVTAKRDCPAVYYLRCSVGGNPDGHPPQLQTNGSYCSGSPTIYDFSGCSSGGGGNDGDEDDPYETDGGGGGVGEGGPGGPGGGGGGPGNGGGGPTTSPDDGQEDTSEMDAFNLNRVNKLGLGLTNAQKDFLVDNPYVIGELESVLDNNSSIEEKTAALMTIDVLRNNKLYGSYNTTYYNIINKYISKNMTDPAMAARWAGHFAMQCAILKQENPDWSDTRVYWEASKEMLHLVLDLGGLVPVVGEVCDIANGIIYTIEGDGVNATLSFSAAIPVAGWFATGAKFAKKGIDLANGSKTTLKWVVKANDVINFGDRFQLAKVLGTKGTGKHAHHIIPWDLKELSIVQKAAKSKKAFHMNDALNGIPLPSSNHLTGHNKYNSKVNEILIRLNNGVGSNNTLAYNRLNDFVGYLDNLIKNNPTKNLGQIADLINF